MNKPSDFIIIPANESHMNYAEQICNEMFESAKARGTGIARRKPEYVANKMKEGKSVIALHKDGRWAGFCYIETWSHGNFRITTFFLTRLVKCNVVWQNQLKMVFSNFLVKNIQTLKFLD